MVFDSRHHLKQDLSHNACLFEKHYLEFHLSILVHSIVNRWSFDFYMDVVLMVSRVSGLINCKTSEPLDIIKIFPVLGRAPHPSPLYLKFFGNFKVSFIHFEGFTFHVNTEISPLSSVNPSANKFRSTYFYWLPFSF
jgi:hypothetical protein